jgi:Zn-dependent M28 family amino/carboxypeptidase
MNCQIPDYFPPPDKRKRPDVPLIEAKLIAKKWTGTPPDKFIAALVSLVSQNNLQSWVNDLSAFPTRHTESPNINKIASWLVDKFKSFGYTDVILHPYTKDGYQLNNVICTKPGTSNTGQIIVLCGHLDCIMENSNNISSNAPGADDNATGIASILEISRILAQVKLEDTVQFIAFSGEEQGYWGSTAYAKYAQANNINIHRLINLDQIGYPSAENTIIIERDMGNRVASNDQESQEFGNVMAQMAVDYTNLRVKLGGIYGSDYMPFEAGGYVVIGAYEGEGNPNYHSSTDTPTTVDFMYVTEVTRMTLATILNETLAVITRARDR